MSRRKQKSTMALIMDVFMDGPLAVAEQALEMAGELVRRRQRVAGHPMEQPMVPAKATRQRRQPAGAALTAATQVYPDNYDVGWQVQPQQTPTAPAATPEPVAPRRRRMTRVPAPAAAIAPRRRGRPAKVKEEDVPLPLTVAEMPSAPSAPSIPPAVRDLPEQVTPDDYDVVEG